MKPYIPKAYAGNDTALLHEFIRERVFAHVITTMNGAPVIAHAPVMFHVKQFPLGAVHFHFAKENSVCGPLSAGAETLLLFAGPDTYVSPDWYAAPGRVPTWNYAAVYARGRPRTLNQDELTQLLDDLSRENERKLAPKKPWTMDKVTPEYIAGLMPHIAGYELPFDSLDGKFKLSQDKTSADREGVTRALRERGDPVAAAVADLMDKHNR